MDAKLIVITRDRRRLVPLIPAELRRHVVVVSDGVPASYMGLPRSWGFCTWGDRLPADLEAIWDYLDSRRHPRATYVGGLLDLALALLRERPALVTPPPAPEVALRLSVEIVGGFEGPYITL